MKPTAAWRQERPWSSAVRHPPPSLHSLPGGHPCESPPDQMHTWHHGVGREFCSSSIVPCLYNRLFHACMAGLHLHGPHVRKRKGEIERERQNIQVLLACRWHVFGGRKNEDRLAAAYDSFHNWCVAERKKSTLKKFELKTFKMTSCFGFKTMHVCARMQGHIHEIMITCMYVCMCLAS